MTIVGWANSDVNSGMFGSWKPAIGTLVGGHCSGKFRQGWGLVSSNAHPTKCILCCHPVRFQAMLWVGKVMVNSGRFGRHRYPGWWALLR
ncbi:hypothetical protein BJP34_23815 [Moorena producens PAL-8-15-08-1]|uniref:Uncharacterized protein n=1 Tax=Moorena producens PAL-8-15-08-1 TaxID=1458985 RepID=A0A1D8TWP1_9CYAN|nr:hypothetical protein BJP34_23815 [Moorena producens PAL-8-15-08-1]